MSDVNPKPLALHKLGSSPSPTSPARTPRGAAGSSNAHSGGASSPTTTDAISTKAMFTVYWFSIHLPNMAMETAKGVTSTVIPILLRQLASNMAASDRNKAVLEADARGVAFQPASTVAATSESSSDAFLGLMLAAIGLGTVVANVPVGSLIRKHSLTRMAALGGILYLLATLGPILLIGNTIWHEYLQPTDDDGEPVVISNFYYRLFQILLLISAFVWGVAFSCMSITRLLFVQHRVPKTYRSRLMSLVGGAQRWSMVLGPFLAGLVTQHVGIFYAFALHIPLTALNSYCFYRSSVFREISDEILEEDALAAAASQRRKSAASTPRGTTSPSAGAVGGGSNTHGGGELQPQPDVTVSGTMKGLVSIGSASSNDVTNPSTIVMMSPFSPSTSVVGVNGGLKNSSFHAVAGLKNTLGGGTLRAQQQSVEDDRRKVAADESLPNTPMVAPAALVVLPAAGSKSDLSIIVGRDATAPAPTKAPSVATNNNNAIPNNTTVVSMTSASAVAILNAAPATAIPQEEEQLPTLKEAVKEHWRILLVIGTFAFTMMFLRSSRNLLLAVNALDLNLPASAVGSILSMSYFIDATFFFLGGYLSDRYGAERIAIFATGTLGLSFLALGAPVSPSDIIITDPNNIPYSYYFTPPVLKLIFVGLLFGVSNSLGSGLVLSLVANHAPKSKGNAVLSLLRSAQDVGPLVGSLLSGVLLDAIGFDATAILFGLGGLANALSAFLFMPKPQTRKMEKKRAAAEAAAAAAATPQGNEGGDGVAMQTVKQ